MDLTAVELPRLRLGCFVNSGLSLRLPPRARITLTDGADRVLVEEVAAPGLSGVFARPKAGTSLPAIILLHGSDGGTMGAARAAAVRFAQLGYAAFAVNYFAYPDAGIKNIPAALLNIPVETVNIAREWPQKKPDVDRRGARPGCRGAIRLGGSRGGLRPQQFCVGRFRPGDGRRGSAFVLDVAAARSFERSGLAVGSDDATDRGHVPPRPAPGRRHGSFSS